MTLPGSTTVSPDLDRRRPSTYVWLLVSVGLMLLQVLPFLSYRWVTDESWYSGPAYSVAQGHGFADPAIGPNDLENHFDARPPGTALVIAAFFRLFGVAQIQARLGSVLAGMLALLLTYRIAREMLDPQGAAVAALILATDTFLVAASRTARPEALSTAAVLLSILLVKRYADTGLARWMFFGGLGMALTTMFHVTILGYLVSLGLLAIVLDVRRKVFPLRGALVYTGGYALGLVPFATWILRSPLGRQAFQVEYMARGTQSLGGKALHELSRYRDFVGLGTMHGHGLDYLPVRLPVPLCFLAATWLLWRYRRQWFYLELLMLLPTLLWFVNTVNKSSRYCALLAPVIALAIGAAVSVAPTHSRARKGMLAAVCLLVALQFGGDVLLLAKARQANYDRLTAELRSVIPPSEPVYATMTFWLAFHNQPFISYERTEIGMAEKDFHVRYFIVGDRMMQEGLATDHDFYQKLGVDSADLASRSDLVGQFVDPYYGHMKIYRPR